MCVLEALSTAFTMASSVAQGNYQAQVAENNANLADQQAKAVTAQGTERDKQIRRNIDNTMGSQKAAFSANGLDIAGGSPLGVLSDTAYLGAIDTQTNQYNVAQDVWALGNQAEQYRSAAGAARAAGRNAAIGSLLTGATKIGAHYAAMGSTTKAAPLTPVAATNSYQPFKNSPIKEYKPMTW